MFLDVEQISQLIIILLKKDISLKTIKRKMLLYIVIVSAYCLTIHLIILVAWTFNTSKISTNIEKKKTNSI